MNNLVKTYFTNLHQNLDALQDVLQRQRLEIASQKATHERQTQELWNRSKELSVLKEAVKSLDSMKAENRRLHDARAELNDRLSQILEYTKALGDEFRS